MRVIAAKKDRDEILKDKFVVLKQMKQIRNEIMKIESYTQFLKSVDRGLSGNNSDIYTATHARIAEVQAAVEAVYEGYEILAALNQLREIGIEVDEFGGNLRGHYETDSDGHKRLILQLSDIAVSDAVLENWVKNGVVDDLK